MPASMHGPNVFTASLSATKISYYYPCTQIDGGQGITPDRLHLLKTEGRGGFLLTYFPPKQLFQTVRSVEVDASATHKATRCKVSPDYNNACHSLQQGTSMKAARDHDSNPCTLSQNEEIS